MATDAARWGKAAPKENEQSQGDEKKEQPAIQRAWQEPKGIWGTLTKVQSDANGERQVAVAFFFFLLGGINALLMRIQLSQPNNTFVSPELYNELFTMHGSTMMYLFAVPFMEGVATMLLPFVLGAREVMWPRLTAFVFWTFTLGGLLFEASWLIGTVPDAGWTAYVPLSEKAFSVNPGLDFWLLALTMVSVGGIFASVILIAAVFKSRAPGMSINRMPLFAWAALAMGFTMFFAFIVIFMGSAYLQFDRKFNTHFYDATAGGSPLLWQHLFWIFGHPDVYIQFIPAAGLISMALPVILRQRVIGYSFLALALVITGFVSFGLWVHHMFAVGIPPLAMTFFTGASMLIAIPAGIQVSAWLATIWRGVSKWTTAYLFILGFLFMFIFGGITGVMLALIPFDWQVHDSFFVVAHFHYVLIGSVVMPIFAGVYFWFPKFKGKFLDERLGKWNFWLLFIGFNVTFFPMHISGLLGMPRRLYTYPSGAGLDILNLTSSIGAFIILAGVLVFLYNFVVSLRHGEPASSNPWDADSLEWATDSPVPDYGFHHIPIIRSRHPLWDQDRLDVGSEKVTRLVNRLAEWPTTWRASMITSTFTGEPEEVYRVAGPSIWPFVATVGMTLMFVSFFFDYLQLIAILGAGALIVLISLIFWHKPTPEEKTISDEELAQFEKDYGIPIYAHGSPTVSLWAYGEAILGFATAMAVSIFCYFYFRFNSPVWPPSGIGRPDLNLPFVATALLVLSVVFGLFAARSVREDQQGRLKLGLGIAFILGIAYLILQLRGYVGLPFDPTTNAYGSSYYATLLLQTIIALLGLGILIGTLVFAWRGQYSARHMRTVTNAMMFWSFVLVSWLAVLVTLYLSPYLA